MKPLKARMSGFFRGAKAAPTNAKLRKRFYDQPPPINKGRKLIRGLIQPVSCAFKRYVQGSGEPLGVHLPKASREPRSRGLARLG